MKHNDNRYPGKCPSCRGKALRQRSKDLFIYCHVCGDGGFSPAAVQLFTSQVNGHNHHPNAGLADKVKKVLARGPHDIEQLAAQLGVNRESVRTCVNQLCVVTGGVEATGPMPNRQYRLFKPKRIEPTGDFSVAQPITHGRGSRWWVGYW